MLLVCLILFLADKASAVILAQATSSTGPQANISASAPAMAGEFFEGPVSPDTWTVTAASGVMVCISGCTGSMVIGAYIYQATSGTSPYGCMSGLADTGCSNNATFSFTTGQSALVNFVFSGCTLSVQNSVYFLGFTSFTGTMDISLQHSDGGFSFVTYGTATYSSGACSGASGNAANNKDLQDFTLQGTINTPAPTPEPTPEPTSAPTPFPTAEPTATPTAFPTEAPVAGTPAPTLTNAPTNAPTIAPTLFPTNAPTISPTPFPTSAPSPSPTNAPTVAPTSVPTTAPTSTPTVAPTVAPSPVPTVAPTASPTVSPTVAPTTVPTPPPSISPVSLALYTFLPSIAVVGLALLVVLIVLWCQRRGVYAMIVDRQEERRNTEL